MFAKSAVSVMLIVLLLTMASITNSPSNLPSIGEFIINIELPTTRPWAESNVISKVLLSVICFIFVGVSPISRAAINPPGENDWMSNKTEPCGSSPLGSGRGLGTIPSAVLYMGIADPIGAIGFAP